MPQVTRRKLLVGGGLTTAAAFFAKAQIGHHLPVMPPAPPLVDPEKLTPFVEALPVAPTAKPVGQHAGAPLYKMSAREVYAKVHPDVPETRFWGFEGRNPGPTIEVRSGVPVHVEWENRLPEKHFLPIDHHVMGAEKNQPEVRIIEHVHGGRTPPEHDH